MKLYSSLVKSIFLLLMGSIIIANPAVLYAQKSQLKYSLTGKVTDQINGQVLIGASVYFPELKKGVITNEKGIYQIQLNAGNHVVEVSYIGYVIYSKTIAIDTKASSNNGMATNNANNSTNITTIQDFALGHTVVESSNVTVTSFLRATSSKRTPTPISILKKEDLFRGASTNFIDALSKTPGVTQLSTGPAISKPVIRGLGYNRVVVLNDGVRQEGQQWGDEHGIEIDEYNVSRTEILKVPASIIYGSEALSGVINIVSNVPVAEGAIRGNIFSNYQSNNKLQGYHLDIAGNNKGFVWGVNGSFKQASDYKNKYDGYVLNSRFKELNGSAYAGIEKDWGFSHFFVSEFTQKLGMIEGERDANGAFIKPDGMVAISSDFESTTPNVPYQYIQHTKYILDNSVKWGTGRLKANIAYQRNQRQEFGNIENPMEKSLYFDLGTLNYAFQYLLPETNNWKHTIGVNGMQQENVNKGLETLIPAYKSVELGLFFYTQKNINLLHLSGGARIDKKGIEFIDHFGVSQQKDYGALAGSVGATYDLTDKWVLKLNIAKGYRAPNLSELGSNGAHEGTNRYEYGNTNLKSEKSLQFDLGTEWSNEHLSFSGNVFYNMVNDYIFYQKLTNHLSGDSVIIKEDKKYYAFAYKQDNADLYGAECVLDIHPHPLDGLHIENTLSYVRGTFEKALDGSNNLPSIPPFRWISELRYELAKKSDAYKNSYISLQFDNVGAQNNPFKGYNTETETPGYTLINIGAGTQVNHKGKQLFSVSLVAQNLTDVAYQNHLSRLKYLSENTATGRMGIFNMGRNYSLKLNVPLVFD